MALSDDMTAKALRLINKFGSAAILVKPSSNTYNVATGTTDVIVGTETTLKAHIESYASEQIKGLVIAGDSNMLISSDGVTFSKDDTIKFKDDVYSIINLMPLWLQDAVVVYELQVRK